jgi:hypothetical protein
MKINAYIYASGLDTHHRDAIIQHLKTTVSATEVHVLDKSENTEIGFAYSISQPVLNSFIQYLKDLDCQVETIYLHLPSEISGITNLYDLSDKGSAMEQTLLNIDGIHVASISPNGVIKIQTEPSNDQDAILVNVTNVMLEFKNSHK